jgi:hypothetical protein
MLGTQPGQQLLLLLRADVFGASCVVGLWTRLLLLLHLRGRNALLLFQLCTSHLLLLLLLLLLQQLQLLLLQWLWSTGGEQILLC